MAKHVTQKGQFVGQGAGSTVDPCGRKLALMTNAPKHQQRTSVAEDGKEKHDLLKRTTPARKQLKINHLTSQWPLFQQWRHKHLHRMTMDVWSWSLKRYLVRRGNKKEVKCVKPWIWTTPWGPMGWCVRGLQVGGWILSWKRLSILQRETK